MGQHLSNAPHDLATLTFEVMALVRCFYALTLCALQIVLMITTFIRVFVLHLLTKFEVRRPLRSKDMTTSGLIISRSGDRDLWLVHCAHYCSCATFLPILAFLERFVFDLSANSLTPVRRITWPSDLDLGGHCTCSWCGSSCCVLCTKF